MFKVIGKSNWLTGTMIFFMPVLLIFFLASQLAYSQVKGKFEVYQNIPEVTRLSELERMPAGQVIMVRGRIPKKRAQVAEAMGPGGEGVAAGLIIFQERPADGREVRFREEFELVFPAFVMDLPDGHLAIMPSLTRERVIQHEGHTVADGDRQRTGFRPGDLVTVQGEWQPGQVPNLSEVTGITGVDKISLVTEWEEAFGKVSRVRNGLGLLTLLSVVLLGGQLRGIKANKVTQAEEPEACVEKPGFSRFEQTICAEKSLLFAKDDRFQAKPKARG